jgi:hypothetical protein
MVTIDVIAFIKSSSVSTAMAPYVGNSWIVSFNSGPRFSKSTGRERLLGLLLAGSALEEALTTSPQKDQPQPSSEGRG